MARVESRPERLFGTDLGTFGRLLLGLALLLGAGSARASGPRWMTGPPYFTGNAGVPVVWYTQAPLYFTDPGTLSSSVNHAAADAMVAAAAGVWNVPTSGLTLAQGGMLNEHVSGANSYLGVGGPVFPADVESSNYQAVQIAVIYDSDGSVTDMLLGGGASSPAECLQNGVTEDVDSIVPAGYIQHALLVLNGRCTGPAPQQQLQMQYQLERAFGRVLGLGWSQTNDNTFTRNPTPTYQQELHWPIMHPIDIVCGQYTYQCLPLPFTLRDDDVSAISYLYQMMSYYVQPATPPKPGKIWTFTQASQIYGVVSFPTGQAMQGVNMVVHRQKGGLSIPEPWEDVSSVTGLMYQRNGGNPVTGTGSDIAASMGSTDPQWEGFYLMGMVPDIDAPGPNANPMTGIVSSEPINPLYTGSHAVGPYTAGGVEPSGSPVSTLIVGYLVPFIDPWDPVPVYFPVSDAANSCNSDGDGVETAPLAVAQTGWWTGVLCAHGNTAWSSFAAQAGRTATVEVTALDESGLATTAKAMPLIGVWGATDATGTLPTVAATPSAFNTVTLGMTATGVATTQAKGLRVAIADSRGDGRPDFAYQARVLYADSVAPAATSADGGQITIGGMGFRAGNEVTVNGVSAVVSSWTATTIVAVAPPVSAFRTNPAGAVDVEVIDLQTGGTTVMTGALTYGNVAPDVMKLVSAPSGMVQVGATAATPFAVRVFLGDGVTPVAGLPVTLTKSGAAATFGACAGASCTVLTDATGLATTTVTPTASGAVTLQAAAVDTTQTATFNAVSQSIEAVRAVEYVAAGATVAWSPQVDVTQNGSPAAGVAVNWVPWNGMTVSTGTSMTNGQGVAGVAATIGPLAAGVQALGQACAWTASPATTMCANYAAVGVAPADWRLTMVSGAGQAVGLGGTFAPVMLLVTDVAGDPVAGAAVTIHQTADAAGMPCPARGACPVAPVLGSSDTAAVSDVNGLVSVTPMQTAGLDEVINVAIAAGTQGFVSLSLQQGP